MLHSVGIVLRTAGVVPVSTAQDSRTVLPLLAEQDVGVLVLNLPMPHSPARCPWSRLPRNDNMVDFSVNPRPLARMNTAMTIPDRRLQRLITMET